MASVQAGESARPRVVLRDIYNYRGQPSTGPSLPVNAAELTHRLQLYQIQQDAKKTRRRRVVELNRTLKDLASYTSQDLPDPIARQTSATAKRDRELQEVDPKTTKVSAKTVNQSFEQRDMKNSALITYKTGRKSPKRRTGRKHKDWSVRRTSSRNTALMDDPNVILALEFMKSNISSECLIDGGPSNETHSSQTGGKESGLVNENQCKEDTCGQGRSPNSASPEKISPSKSQRPDLSSRRSSSSSIRRQTRRTTAVYIPRNARSSHIATTTPHVPNIIQASSTQLSSKQLSKDKRLHQKRVQPKTNPELGNTRQTRAIGSMPEENNLEKKPDALYNPRSTLKAPPVDEKSTYEVVQLEENKDEEDPFLDHEILERTANDRPNWSQQDEHDKSRRLSTMALNFAQQLRRISAAEKSAKLAAPSKNHASISTNELSNQRRHSSPTNTIEKATVTETTTLTSRDLALRMEQGADPRKQDDSMENSHKVPHGNNVGISGVVPRWSEKTKSRKLENSHRNIKSRRKTVEIVNTECLSVIEEKERLLRHQSLHFGNKIAMKDLNSSTGVNGPKGSTQEAATKVTHGETVQGPDRGAGKWNHSIRNENSKDMTANTQGIADLVKRKH